MHYVVKRFGFRVPRALIALVLVAGLIGAGAFWIGPFRPLPADLRVLALSGDGRFTNDVGIPSRWADTATASDEAVARFPLILAVHNAGSQPAQPTQLALSLPARFRLATNRGLLEQQVTPGNPLARYELTVETPRLEPGAAPTLIGGADTLWLEPAVPTMYCTILPDSVPEFVAAPAQDPNALASVHIFYSLEGRDIRQRQAGLVKVRLDPTLVARRPVPQPPVFPTTIVKPEAPAPALSELREVGNRISSCGEPGQPVQLQTVLYETIEGGRFFVLYYGGAPRKHLYDLNRDSIVELEMWDSNGDGKFEARRNARFAIPSFLMPRPELEEPDVPALAAADTMPLDSAWLRAFHDTTRGPLRFARPDTGAARTVTPSPVTPAAVDSTVTPGRVDSAALRLFHYSEGGPLRFRRAEQGDTARPPPPAPRPDTPRRPRLLGVPYNPGGQ